jgi:hypothetical protein
VGKAGVEFAVARHALERSASKPQKLWFAALAQQPSAERPRTVATASPGRRAGSNLDLVIASEGVRAPAVA